MGIKITAQVGRGLKMPLLALSYMWQNHGDDSEDFIKAAEEDMNSVISRIDRSGEGVCVTGISTWFIGRIASIENNHEPVYFARKGKEVSIKIVGVNEERQKMFGRQFEVDDELVSHISGRCIDVLKANYRDDLSTEEWSLDAKLKGVFNIQRGGDS